MVVINFVDLLNNNNNNKSRFFIFRHAIIFAIIFYLVAELMN